MNKEEFDALKKAMYELADGINERFEKEREKVLDKVRETLNEYGQQSASESIGWDSFRKQSEYIQLLVQIQGADHNVHKELDEAIAKIKQLTYQG